MMSSWHMQNNYRPYPLDSGITVTIYKRQVLQNKLWSDHESLKVFIRIHRFLPYHKPQKQCSIYGYMCMLVIVDIYTNIVFNKERLLKSKTLRPICLCAWPLSKGKTFNMNLTLVHCSKLAIIFPSQMFFNLTILIV